MNQAAAIGRCLFVKLFVMHHALSTIIDLFQKNGSQHYGENLTQLEHALQCATLAEAAGADDEVVIAALLHDIGHLLDHNLHESNHTLGNTIHEDEGAAMLEAFGFSDNVVILVKNHVAAKRYLTAVEPNYFSSLSVASKKTLQIQGGPMSPTEIENFQKNPQFQLIVQLRHWDDLSKIPDLITPPLSHFIQKAEKLLNHPENASE